MKHNWKKSSPELVALFDSVIPDTPPIKRRKMFGYPCFFINGNMSGGLHEENFLLRLSEVDRQAIEKLSGHVFSPFPGRVMKEYIVIPPAILNDAAELRTWITRSIEYTSSLPDKK